MGKRIIAQRRGRGSMLYRAPSHKYFTSARYDISKQNGKVIDIINDPARSTPVAELRHEDGSKNYFLAAEGLKTGDVVEFGPEAKVQVGNVLPVSKIPEGTPVFNIESKPNDGGKLVRSAGDFALIVSHDVGKTVVKLPSNRFKPLPPDCRATIGISAGGERKAKPFVKAGTKHHAMRAKNKLYPRTSARAMNAVDHKLGGSNLGVAKTTSRNAPPGRKIGSIASKRTGNKK